MVTLQITEPEYEFILECLEAKACYSDDSGSRSYASAAISNLRMQYEDRRNISVEKLIGFVQNLGIKDISLNGTPNYLEMENWNREIVERRTESVSDCEFWTKEWYESELAKAQQTEKGDNR